MPVHMIGSIANTQVAFGNGTSIAGDAGFTYNSTTDTASLNGSANSLNLAGSATTLPVTLAATGTDASIPIKIAPKGDQGFVQLGTDTLGVAGWAESDLSVEIYNSVSRTDNAFGLYLENAIGDFADGYNRGIYVKATSKPSGATQNLASITGGYFSAESYLPVGKTVGSMTGSNSGVTVSGEGSATDATAVYAQVYVDSGGKIDNAIGVQSAMYDTITTPGTGKQYAFAAYRYSVNTPNSEAYSYWASDLTGAATNAYFLWYDSPGVFRIKSDGVMAYYNPSFTKYTPGAANHERIIQQWNSDVAEIGTERGGTGTLRPLKLLGSAIRSGVDVVVQDSAKGVVLKDTAGTPHYWRLAVSTLGVITATDIGTTSP